MALVTVVTYEISGKGSGGLMTTINITGIKDGRNVGFIEKHPYLRVTLDEEKHRICFKKGFKNQGVKNQVINDDRRKLLLGVQDICTKLVDYEGFYVLEYDAEHNCYYVDKQYRRDIPDTQRKGSMLGTKQQEHNVGDRTPIEVEEPVDVVEEVKTETKVAEYLKVVNTGKPVILNMFRDWVVLETKNNNFDKAKAIIDIMSQVEKL